MKLKGKCKTCLGCNKLDEIGFKGVRKCKYYQSGRNKEILFYIIEIILLLALGYAVYVKISMFLLLYHTARVQRSYC